MMITILIVLCHNGILPVYSNKQLGPHSQSITKWGVQDFNFKKGQKSLASTTIDDNLKIAANERQLVRVTDDYKSATRTHRQVQHRRRPRSALRNRSALWLWRNGIVPYVLSSKYNRTEKGQILSAFDDFHKKTYVRFVPQTTQQDYLSILPDDVGCYMEGIGRKGGRQTVSFKDGCFGHGTLLHELMQALGFFHEHTRPDRDDYVRIEWHNIAYFTEFFDKKNSSPIQTLVQYDYESVMHSDAYVWSRNGNPTIVPLEPGVKIGQRKGFSEGDVKRINLLYEPYTIFDPLPSATTANTPPMHSGRQWACGWESSDGNPSPLWTCKWVRTQN